MNPLTNIHSLYSINIGEVFDGIIVYKVVRRLTKVNFMAI